MLIDNKMFSFQNNIFEKQHGVSLDGIIRRVLSKNNCITVAY